MKKTELSKSEEYWPNSPYILRRELAEEATCKNVISKLVVKDSHNRVFYVGCKRTLYEV
jgi:hypothetical protein